MSVSKTVNHISECFIKPNYEVSEAKQPYHLAPMDLAMLSAHYIQQGLLFDKPSNFDTQLFLQSLKDSLSHTLVHFYPLAGQLATQVHVNEGQQKSVVFVDCNKGPGARFIHAMVDMSISDILSPTDVPEVVQSLFDHKGAVNYDGHHMSLLTIQVTELRDGVFIGCSMNHCLGDGTSYWHFWNTWSDIHTTFRCKEKVIVSSHMPIHKRWSPKGHDLPILLPFTQLDDFVGRHEEPHLRVRIFHFSPKSIARLKAKANEENGYSMNKISSFQALSALYWRSIIRALCLPHDQVTNCRLLTNNRQRFDPPLPQEYFGNCISALKATATVGELLENNLGWAASLLHQSVMNYGKKEVQDLIDRWLQSPAIYNLSKVTDSYSLMMGNSPRFDMYGNEFGLGKAVAVRRAHGRKFIGKVTAYPGYEGGGSVNLEMCLPPHSMKALESDEEFMCAVSFPLKEQ